MINETPDRKLVIALLHGHFGHSHYGIEHLKRKKRVKGCKYMGQMPIYVVKDGPGLSIHIAPMQINDELIDKLCKMKYIGLKDVGPKKIPVFKEQDDTTV